MFKGIKNLVLERLNKNIDYITIKADKLIHDFIFDSVLDNLSMDEILFLAEKSTKNKINEIIREKNQTADNNIISEESMLPTSILNYLVNNSDVAKSIYDQINKVSSEFGGFATFKSKRPVLGKNSKTNQLGTEPEKSFLKKDEHPIVKFRDKPLKDTSNDDFFEKFLDPEIDSKELSSQDFINNSLKNEPWNKTRNDLLRRNAKIIADVPIETNQGYMIPETNDSKNEINQKISNEINKVTKSFQNSYHSFRRSDNPYLEDKELTKSIEKVYDEQVHKRPNENKNLINENWLPDSFKRDDGNRTDTQTKIKEYCEDLNSRTVPPANNEFTETTTSEKYDNDLFNKEVPLQYLKIGKPSKEDLDNFKKFFEEASVNSNYKMFVNDLQTISETIKNLKESESPEKSIDSKIKSTTKKLQDGNSLFRRSDTDTIFAKNLQNTLNNKLHNLCKDLPNAKEILETVKTLRTLYSVDFVKESESK